MQDLEDLKRLAFGATQGPWYDDSAWSPDDVSIWNGSPGDASFIGNVGGSRLVEIGVAFDIDANNARYICAANPSNILELIDRCESAEKERDDTELKREMIANIWSESQKEVSSLRAELKELREQNRALDLNARKMRKMAKEIRLNIKCLSDDIKVDLPLHKFASTELDTIFNLCDMVIKSLPDDLQSRDSAEPVAVPDGWRLVPVEATEAMLARGGHVNSEFLNDNAPLGISRYIKPMQEAYKAMVLSAPKIGE